MDRGSSSRVRIVRAAALLIAFAGLYVTGVLSLGHVLDVPVPCGGSKGCGAVAAHPSSKFFGVPIAFIGVGAYLAIILTLTRAGESARARRAALALTLVGAATSAALLWHSRTVIGATCLWCVGSAAAMWALAGLTVMMCRTRCVRDTPPHSLYVWGLAFLTTTAVGLQAGWMEREAKRPPIEAPRLAAIERDELVDPAKTLGPADAPVTVVIFADLSCPACRAAHHALVKFQKDNPRGVRLVWRHVPLWEHSAAAAALSEIAAEQGKFWEFAETLYADPRRFSRAGLLGLMRDLGLDAEEAERRIADGEDPSIARLNADLALAEALGVHATPTFVVLVEGRPPVSANQRTLETYLNSVTVQARLAASRSRG